MRRNLVDFPSDDDTGSDRDYSMGQKAYDAVAAVWVTAVGTDGGEHSSSTAEPRHRCLWMLPNASSTVPRA